MIIKPSKIAGHFGGIGGSRLAWARWKNLARLAELGSLEEPGSPAELGSLVRLARRPNWARWSG